METKNLIYGIIFPFLFLLQFQKVKGNTAPIDTLWSKQQLNDSINSHLSQLFISNFNNDKKGESHKNKYVLFYNFGSPADLTSCTTPYFSIGPFQSSNVAIDVANSMIELADSLCHFNNNTLLTLNNSIEIKKYAIYYGFPENAGKTKLTSELSAQSAIIPFMEQIGAGENYSVFSNARQDIENKILLNQEIPLEVLNAEHRIITIGSLYYEISKPESEFQDVFTKTFYIKDDILTEQVFNRYIEYCNKSTPQIDPFLPFGGQLGTRVRGFINFFSNPNNFNLDFTACDIPAQSPIAQQVRSCYCNLPLNIKQKQGLYNLIRFVDNSAINQLVYNPYSTPGWSYFNFVTAFNCENPSTEFINTIFTEYVSSNTTQTLQEYILANKIVNISPEDVNPHAYLYWLSVATISDFEKLSVIDRISFIKIFKSQHSGGTYYLRFIKDEGSGEVSLTQIIYELLHNTPTSSSNVLVSTLTNNGDLLNWLFYKVCNDLFVGDDSEHKVIKAFNNILIKSQGGIGALNSKIIKGDFNNKGLVWQPAVWWWNTANNYNYRRMAGNVPFVNNEGKVSFSANLITSAGVPLFGEEYAETFPFLDPFEIIPVTKGSTYSWLTDDGGPLGGDCSNGVLDCTKVTYLPAISVVWYIEKLIESQQIAGLITSVEIASMFVGVGQLNALIKVTNASRALKIRRALAGFEVASTFTDLFVPGASAIALDNLSGWSDSEIAQFKSKFQKITGVVALTGGAAQISDAIIGIGKFRALKHKVSQLNEDEFFKVRDDIAKYLSTRPEDMGKVLTLLDITNTSVRALINNVGDYNRRLSFIAELADLPAHIRNNSKAAEVLENILNGADDALVDDIVKLYGELPPLRRQKLFEDIEASNMADDFIQNRRLIESYMVFSDEISGTTKFLRDRNSILTLFDKLNNPLLAAKVGGVAELRIALRQMVKRNKWLGCDACGAPSGYSAFFSKMPDFLDEAEHLIINFDITSTGDANKFYYWIRGFYENGNSFGENVLPIEHELHQTIHYLKGKGFTANTHVDALGANIGSTPKKTDLTMKPNNGAKYRELKSYKEGNGLQDVEDNVLTGLYATPLKNRPQFRSQFIDGYIKEIKSLSELEYIFESRKLGSGDITLLRTQFKDMIDTYRNSIWTNMTTELKIELMIIDADGLLDVSQSFVDQIVKTY